MTSPEDSPTQRLTQIHGSARERILERVTAPAVSALAAALDRSGPAAPSILALQSAAEAAQDAVLEAALAAQSLDQLTPDATPELRKTFPLKLRALMPPLRLPEAICELRLEPLRLGLAAALGAILGLLVLTPLCVYLLQMRDLGLLLGGPLGALLMLWGLVTLTESVALQKALSLALGVATFTEAATFIFGLASPFGLAARFLQRGTASAMGRSRRLLFLGLALLLRLLARRRTVYDRPRHEQLCAEALRAWVDGLLPRLLILAAEGHTPKARDAALDKLIARIGEKLLILQRCQARDLPFAAHEILLECRSLGFEGIVGEPTFLRAPPAAPDVKAAPDLAPPASTDTALEFAWAEEHFATHETFGHIELGDRVREEHTPVVFQGRLQKKGLVRKVRRPS